MKKFSIAVILLCGWMIVLSARNSNVVIYPAPEGEVLNEKYHVYADNQAVPVYNAKVGAGSRWNRERAMDDLPNSHLFYDTAAFAYFDLKNGKVTINVAVSQFIDSAKILPVSYHIVPKVKGNTLSFEINRPQHLTVEINGEHVRSLHIFVNPEERNAPSPSDPNVIYFGPGVHTLSKSVEVGDNQTVYLSGGAVVRCFDDSTDVRPSFILKGKNIVFRGRGIIDQENVNRMKARQMVSLSGEDIKIEGVILRNASVWTVTLRVADKVHIDNIKLLGHRANSDGIDICDSWDVLVENCFIRTLDDLIVIKTYNREKGSGRIVARKCVLWNEVAHALSIGAEIRQTVDDVLFTDCDIIGDHCREWSLRVYQCDKGVVKNIRFENIRIEESVRFASVWINQASWSTDVKRGYIENVVFKDITVSNHRPYPLKQEIELLGFDKEHAIKNVLIQNVVIKGKKVTIDDISKNGYVSDIKVLP
jgi:polygalacturonase